MTTIEKIRNNKQNYFNHQVKKVKINASEIRGAVTRSVESLSNCEMLIRVHTCAGHSNGFTNASAAFGAKHEYYGLMDGEIVRVPFFAPDSRYFSKTGVADCQCLEIEDDEALKINEALYDKKVTVSTKAFRGVFREDAECNDQIHGAENWYAVGNTKTGFTIFFKVEVE